MEFATYPKTPRLISNCVITEKIDGTNAQVTISDDGRIFTGSRNRWVTPEDDNYGFAAWCRENEAELLKLGPGRHYGEWWGQGIQRVYGQLRKRFSLFNVGQWSRENAPACCDVVPVLYRGEFSTGAAIDTLRDLLTNGSVAAPGFDRPEGVIVFHERLSRVLKLTGAISGARGFEFR